MPAGVLAVVLSFAAAAFATAAPPPNEPVPRDPSALAQMLARTDVDLRTALDGWRDTRSAPPNDVVLLALYEQRIYRLLVREPRRERATLARVPHTLATVARDYVHAQREIRRITPPLAVSAIRVGPAKPAAVLLGYYREGERRFGVPWNVLAAVNFVESKFGKLRSNSAAGAQGPMQFMPGTWRRYGLGGNVHDPHDAILGAANYLRASGAPRQLRRALHEYNPSSAYVDAILRYSRHMRADARQYLALYCWQVFVKTARGDRRVTGPGLP